MTNFKELVLGASPSKDLVFGKVGEKKRGKKGSWSTTSKKRVKRRTYTLKALKKKNAKRAYGKK